MNRSLCLTLVICVALAACSTVTVTRMNNYRLQKKQVYKVVDGLELNGDLYTPSIPGAKPAVLVVHGGSWASRSGDMHTICEDLAGSGFVVFNITYRLAPASLFPKPVEDVRDAILFLRKHAAELEINPNQISAWGYSAGSQLILMAGLDPNLHLRAIVAGGTPADLTAWPDSPVVTKFIGKTYAEAPGEWANASPVNHVSAKSPPVFLYHGQNDHIVEPEQMEKMRAALAQKNVEVQTHTVPILGHIFVYLFSEESIKLGIAFLEAHVSNAIHAGTPKDP
jgi:acetyl esterase/lipase